MLAYLYIPIIMFGDGSLSFHLLWNLRIPWVSESDSAQHNFLKRGVRDTWSGSASTTDAAFELDQQSVDAAQEQAVSSKSFLGGLLKSWTGSRLKLSLNQYWNQP